MEEDTSELTEQEQKSIDDYEKEESNEDKDKIVIIKAYIGIIILTILLSLELYHNIELFGVTFFLCLSTITLQIIYKHYT